MKKIIFISVALLCSVIINSQNLKIGKQSPFEVGSKMIFYDDSSGNNLTIDLPYSKLTIQKTQGLCSYNQNGSLNLTEFKIKKIERKSGLVKINALEGAKTFLFLFKDPYTNYNYNDGTSEESYEAIESIEKISEPIKIAELKKNPTTGKLVPTKSKFAFTINKIDAIVFIGEALKEVNDIRVKNEIFTNETPKTNPFVSESDETIEAEFTGGKEKMYQYISKRFVVPQHEPAGEMIAEITIETDGRISKVKITKGIDSETDKEFRRVLEGLPRFEHTAQKNGKPVVSIQTIPLTIGSPTDIKNYETKKNK